ncbi:histidine phosphatase family protein [Azohydromonas caseinilytica]|uniref:Fructose-2,6-bisphosphatase n=1 Tax=Azohydromonas caseinilytica TaxID=2728836 RepID=A0A848F7C9_9BURK|nr:histidine phosphatase family protein [Azohydromonas caseinilytica]NML16017.1 fructose-2,6-bisphosphatase [Azohydromonas caseinilytica]
MAERGASRADESASSLIWAWRHPRPEGAQGRCIGRTDLRVDPRRARRLARRIDRAARRAGLPRMVWTSPLRRCAAVGRWLRRLGWTHRIDPALLEMDFGAWDGLSWDAIARAEVDAWCADFSHGRPGGGESLARMLERAAAWPVAPAVVVAHGGWMLARRWSTTRGTLPRVHEWPAAPGYGELWRLG